MTVADLWDRFQRHDAASYDLTRWLFLRMVGLIFFGAFLSFGLQLGGLIGSNGIVPASSFLQAVADRLGAEAYLRLPTLAWISSQDGVLYLLTYGGALVSLLVVADLFPVASLVVAWGCYLSLVSVGQVFLSYQWDILLLETGFLSIFASFSPSFVWLYRWLLFRLMFYSGCFKLMGGDPVWWDLTALQYHHETQPLPTMLAWYAHHLPLWMHKVATFLTLAVEIVVPFLLFLPRPIRRWSVIPLVGLQVGIMLTGNYTFFNILTIALCIFALDDTVLSRLGDGLQEKVQRRFERYQGMQIARPLTIAAFVLIVASSGLQFIRGFGGPAWGESVLAFTRPFHLTSRYGLFVNMTTERPEIVLEGSTDGEHWTAYDFRFKPDDPQEAPRWVAPHQPRLDWQMWFAALRGDYRRAPWFSRFVYQLLRGSDEVEALLAENPFPDAPPTYIRAVLYQYRFSNIGTAGDAWWTRDRQRLYMPPVSLDNFRRQ